jgi:F-type H+-transporting ATPase subunit gamma
MSGTTVSLSRKLAGAHDLEGVVRSMKALAASSIGQYEKSVLSLHAYYRTVELGLIACLRQSGPPPVVEGKGSRHLAKIGAVVFGSDQGLVGRFNEVLVESAVRTLKTLPGKLTQIWAVGERAHSLIADAGLCPVSLLSVPNSVDAITPLVGQLLIEIEAARKHDDSWHIHVFHNQPQSGAIYEPVSKKLLPLDRAWEEKIAGMPWPSKALPDVIEGVPSALQAFLREYLFVLLFQASAESLASENASRLAAMQRAEKNIEGILENLNRTLHRIRQESIDEELFDVISGFEALTKHPRDMTAAKAVY